MMLNLFERSRSHWVRYDHYELKTTEDGKRYIIPGKSANPNVYNPLKEVPNLVLDALNIGMLMMGRKPDAEVEKAIMEFITRYGLLGPMTALPTTPSFSETPFSFGRIYSKGKRRCAVCITQTMQRYSIDICNYSVRSIKHCPHEQQRPAV